MTTGVSSAIAAENDAMNIAVRMSSCFIFEDVFELVPECKVNTDLKENPNKKTNLTFCNALII